VRSAAFRTEIRPVTLEVVQAAIPGDGVLIEFAVYRPFDPKAERNEEAYGPPHYAAYVIPKHGTPDGFDLGAVADIDPLVVRLREALRNPADTQARARGRAVDERILRPLRARLNGATRLLLSPDGGLNLVPFEALVDQRGTYLIERYATTYLTSGRDLVRMQIPGGAGQSPSSSPIRCSGNPPRGPALSRARGSTLGDGWLRAIHAVLRATLAARGRPRDQGPLSRRDALDRASGHQGHTRARRGAADPPYRLARILPGR
jgi:hypothetical protein